MSQVLEPPYYAVIFTSKRRVQGGDGYPETAAQMDALAQTQPGFLGFDSVRSTITVSYWKDESSIKAWKGNLDHLLAQKKGKNDWYLRYQVHVSRVERTYAGGMESDSNVI
ncbi:putative enzyme [Mycena belliarum]|uniref:Enzyme n=1 Tax=Mycena belliarum TaxID=1033014 RepID=A0AAD6XPX6_9AGAR|nr:putative enzyme [Mycena belliae]